MQSKKLQKVRNKIVTYLFNTLDLLECPNDLIGLYIFAFHVFLPFFIFIAILFCLWYEHNRITQVICLISLIPSLLYELSGGCILTLLEFKLLNMKYTQQDIIFYMLGCQHFEKEQKNEISLCCMHVQLILLFFTFFLSNFCERKCVLNRY